MAKSVYPDQSLLQERSEGLCRKCTNHLGDNCMKIVIFGGNFGNFVFMPSTSEKLRGNIGLGLSVRPSVRFCP